MRTSDVATRALYLLLDDGGSDTLRDVVSRLRASGAGVLVGTRHPVEAMDCLPTEAVRDLEGAARSRGPAFRRVLHRAGPREKLWVLLRNDEWIDRWLPRVDVIIGLDPVAIEAARRLAKRQRDLHVSNERHAHSGGRRHLAEAESTTVGTVQLEMARRVVDRALAALAQNDEVGAERVVHAALPDIADPRLRADVLGDVVSFCLDQGRGLGLAYDAYAAELAVADEHLAAREYREAASSFMEAARTAFSPVLHLQGVSSPLADDPKGYVAPLRHSAVAAVLRGDTPSLPGQANFATASIVDRAGLTPLDRPLRLLLATHSDDWFLRPIRAHFSAHPEIDTRFVNVGDSTAVREFGKRQAAFVTEVLSGGRRLPDALEESFGSHVEWADVMLVEWCTALAALVSRMDRSDTRVIVRLHSWEAFSWWPHLVDMRGVDDVVFVSDHVRDFAAAAVPGLGLPKGPRRWVLPNAMDLRRFARPKADDARFTLGVVGASRVVKDPRWAVDVVKHLRRRDERYRLRLIRGVLDDEGPATRRYADELRRDIGSLPAGTVEITPHTDNLPLALQDVGVVVSSSVRESFHIGLVEGVASGALPVVRDWPYFPGAAATLFPPEWVAETPAQAADRIASLTADVGRWRSTAREAAQTVLRTWDWSVVHHQYERLLRGADLLVGSEV